MPDNARVIEAILNEDGNLSKLVVEQEDHTVSKLDVTAPDSWMQLLGDNVVGLDEEQSNVFVTWSVSDDPSPRGTSISFNEETPEEIVIEEDGFYDIAFLMGAQTAANSPSVYAYVFLNDDSVGPLYYWSLFLYPEAGVGGRTGSMSIPKVALSAGDVLKLNVYQSGDATDSVTILNPRMIVARVG